MAYQVQRINSQTEGEVLFTTFVLTDDENIMPEVRLEKQFKITDTLDQRISNQIEIDKLMALNQWLNNQ